MRTSRSHLWVEGIFWGLYLSVSVFYLFYGRVFLDAGFYLDAAARVYGGEMPYRDFFFVQGPVYPYVYGAALGMLHRTVPAARLVSLGFSLAALGLAVGFARRHGGVPGAVACLLALGLAPLHAYYFISVKLYALTGFFVMASLAVLNTRIAPFPRYLLSAILIVLAAGTRMTLVPGVLVMFIAILVTGWRKYRTKAVSAVLIAGCLGIAMLLPFALADMDALTYNLIKIHVSAGEGAYSFSFFHKFKVLLKILAAYPVLSIEAAAAVWILLSGAARRMNAQERTGLALFAAVTVAHLSANWFSAGYQSVLMPLAAALAGGYLGANLPDFRRSFLFLAAVLCIPPLVYTAREPVWSWKTPALKNLARVGAFLRNHTPPGGRIAACNAVLVYAAGRRPFPPFGGAPFTFTPAWSGADCRRFGGINTEMLIRALTRRQPAALALQEDSFSVGFPGFFPVSERHQAAIFDAIRSNYESIAVFPNLGDGTKNLEVFIPKSSP